MPMTHFGNLHPRGQARALPFLSPTARPGVAMAVGVAILVLQLAVLAMLGRELGCGCAQTRLWGGLSTAESSRHWADPYSALHLGFGLGLLLLFSRLRPGWRIQDLALLVLISHAIWEVAENLPFMVGRFHHPGAALPYLGDSLANSLGDTAFAFLGVAIGRQLPPVAILAVIALLEAGVTIAIGDGYLLGLLRLAGTAG